MSTRKGRPVRPSMRGRPPIRRSRSWEDPERMMELETGRHTKLKNCCRSVATFMCTQVGVGGIIVGYAIVGAFGFMALETQDDSVADSVLHHVISARVRTASQLYSDYTEYPFNETEWKMKADVTLHAFQRSVVDAVKMGYDGRTAKEQWNFPAALMFTLSIFTMIGYGNLVPRTEWGKVITIFYAVFGIPLYILYFMNMGKALASIFKWLYVKINSCAIVPDDGGGAGQSPSSPHHPSHSHRSRSGDMEEDETVIVPSSASIYVLFSYICVGTIMFAEWEEWEYLDSVYFCVTSLCKIGLGDFVPGTNIDETEEGNQTKLVINFIYLLLGLGLVAMCYNLLKEEVLAKLKQLKTDVKDVFHYNTLKIDLSLLNPVTYISKRRCEIYNGRTPEGILLLEMDETENMIGMSDDENSSCASNEASGALCDATSENGVVVLQQDQQSLDSIVSVTNNTSASVDGDETSNQVTVNNGTEVVGMTPQRYLQVDGFDGRQNDIVYCRPLQACSGASENEDSDAQSTGIEEDKPKVMLFFGGDIQDFPEMMEQHRDHRNYVTFNLEATAMTIQKQFPDHHIVVVRPSRIQMLTFSCYDNFVHCNHTGAPEHVITHHSLHHLELLLQNLSKRIAKGVDGVDGMKLNADGSAAAVKTEGNDEDATVSSTTIDESSGSVAQRGSTDNSKLRLDRGLISLVGFSKGCVVLNQLLYEFHYLKTLTPDDLSMNAFLSCIKDMYWLDGGHNGGKNTWITSRSLLETLIRLGIRIHVHLTPYQLSDDRRPWIRKEEKLFSELLKKFNAPIVRRIHFENEQASLQQHLRIIADFGTMENVVGEINHENENNVEH